MPRAPSLAFTRIRAEVLRLLALIPAGRFTTYGSIAIHMNIVPRHVASVLSQLSAEEAATLPWHRVVAADARISPNMPAALARRQLRLLKAEGLRIDKTGRIQDSDARFHVVGLRRDIRWGDDAPSSR